MFGASLIGKGKAVALRNYGQNEAERALGPYLYDDDVQVMSSFEMNKFASLTYGTQVCIDLFNLMGDVLLSPADSTVLALQKTLALLRHVVVYGSEDAATRARDMVPLVARLLNFNTVLHVDGGAGDSFLSRMRGGAVDRGAPVREEAAKTHELLRDPERVRVLRERHADPSSLVPIGDRSTVLFRSDEEAVRAERAAAANAGHVVRSNLAKESNGFGSGYNARDGERVVGAAHSVEEMIAAANMEQSRYVDDENDPEHLRRVEEMERVKKNLEDVRREEAERRDAERSRHARSQQHQQQHQQQSVDLLDFGGQSSTTTVVASSQQQTATTLDIFDTPVPNGNAGNTASNGSTGATHDLMGFTSVATTTNTTITTTPGVNQDLLALSSLSTTTTTTSAATASADLMGLSSLPTTATNGSVVHDPFAPVSAATEPRPNETSTSPSTTNDHDDGPGFLSGAKTVLRSIMGASSSSSTAADESIPKKSFAELDRLAESNSNHHRDGNADASSSSSFALDDLSRSLPSDAPSTALPSVEIRPPPSEAPPPLPSEAPPPPPFEAPPPVPEMGVGFNSYDGTGDDGGLGSASLMGGAAPPTGPRGLMGGLGNPGLGAGSAPSTAPPLPTPPPPPVPPTPPPPPVDAANDPMAMMQQQMMMMQASMTPEQQQRMLQQQMLMMQTMMMNMNQNGGGGGSNAGGGPNGGGSSGFSGP